MGFRTPSPKGSARRGRSDYFGDGVRNPIGGPILSECGSLGRERRISPCTGRRAPIGAAETTVGAERAFNEGTRSARAMVTSAACGQREVRCTERSFAPLLRPAHAQD